MELKDGEKINIYTTEFTNYLVSLLCSEPVKLMIAAFKFNYAKNPKNTSHYKKKINELYNIVYALDKLGIEAKKRRKGMQ